MGSIFCVEQYDVKGTGAGAARGRACFEGVYRKIELSIH